MLLGVLQPKQEAPAGTIDGNNKMFTLSNAPLPNTLALYKNGIFLTPGIGADYTLLGNQVTYAVAPQPPTLETSGDSLYAQYLY